jgi:thiosulfate/3-mercaptopyruvate sulfurtransferase
MRYRFAALACTLALVATRADAQRASTSPRDNMLVSTSWLAQHLRDPDLVLLHVGDKSEYQTKHFEGARVIELADIASMSAMGSGVNTLEMLAPDTLRGRLAALGISDRSRIIVYYGSDWVSPATRVVFTLDYAGLGANTSLLDGGMGAWARDGNQVTTAVRPAKAGTLSAVRTKPIVVDADYVRAHLEKPGVSIVDARAAALYDGLSTGGMADHRHKTGHVAGAKSIPFTEGTGDKLLWKSTEDLAALFAKAGVQKGDTIVAYCHLGQQATATLFAARLLGYPVLLYDGSVEDWSRRSDEYRVDNPQKKDKP